jgi:cysteine desulfurase/selenocysteine lyase
VVIDAISKYYQESVIKWWCTYVKSATDAYEISRAKIQNHLNAKHLHEVLLLLEQPLVLTWFRFTAILKPGIWVLVSVRASQYCMANVVVNRGNIKVIPME